MAFKEVNPSYLNKEELLYEVNIREESPESTVDALRKQLRSLLNDNPSNKILKTDLEPNEELSIIEQKLKELQELLMKQNRSPSSATQCRSKTLSCHLHYRLNRVEVEEASIKQKVSFYKGSLNTLLEMFEQSASSFSQEVEAVEQPAPFVVQESKLQVEYQQGEKTSGASFSLVGDKCISKWDVRFNGVSDPWSFLDRVDDLQRADGVSDQKLLNSAARLFVDQALI